MQPRSPSRRTMAATAGWAAAAVAATLIGVGGIRLVGESLTGTPGGVRSQQDVERALAAAPVPTDQSTAPARPVPEGQSDASARPGRTDQPTDPGSATDEGQPGISDESRAPARSAAPPTPSGQSAATPTATRSAAQTFAVRGGTVIATCSSATRAYLVSWSPNPGWQVDEHRQGPAAEAEVRFEGDGARSELRVTCANGHPRAERRERSR